jgi:hypothetical protein
MRKCGQICRHIKRPTNYHDEVDNESNLKLRHACWAHKWAAGHRNPYCWFATVRKYQNKRNGRRRPTGQYGERQYNDDISKSILLNGQNNRVRIRLLPMFSFHRNYMYTAHKITCTQHTKLHVHNTQNYMYTTHKITCTQHTKRIS